jgi:hypothetical protein
MAAAAPAGVETASIRYDGEPIHVHFIKKIKHAYVPVVRSPACYTLQAPYDVFIPAVSKSMVSTEILVKLPIDTLGLISACADWKLSEHLDII